MTAPLSGRPCLFYQVEVRTETTHGYRYPEREVHFEVDDGFGQVLIRVPPPAPEPIPGDDLSWEVVCSLGRMSVARTFKNGESPVLDRLLPVGFPFLRRSGQSYYSRTAKATERVITAGDTLSVGGFASLQVVAEGHKDGPRSVPVRFVLTTNTDYRLVIVQT